MTERLYLRHSPVLSFIVKTTFSHGQACEGKISTNPFFTIKRLDLNGENTKYSGVFFASGVKKAHMCNTCISIKCVL